MGRDVKLIYRRSGKEMPASKLSVTEATEEGVDLQFSTQPVRLITQNNELVGVECVRTQPGEPDPSRPHRVEPVSGTEFVIPTDAVVTARGKKLDLEDLADSVDVDGGIRVDFQFHTSLPGVYACGTCVSSCVTVGDAVRMGRQAAHEAHSRLVEGSYQPANPLKRRGASSEVAKIKNFNRAYHQVETPAPLEVREPEERIKDTDEVVLGLSESDVRREAARCFKCGTCILCDNCYLFCPDAAICKRTDGSGYDILGDYCKGCGVCVEECPRGAIHLRRVEFLPPDAETAGDEP
jgi:Pyruvate/2-oxoacid:ferredoxin oxidoreductase delta subunit